MKAQVPWLRVGVEGVVIVGSILLALGLDAAWEERQERAEEQSILRELRAEFETNQDILRGTERAHRRGLSAMLALVSVSETNLSTAASLDTLFGAAAITPHYNPQTGALAASISSGRLSLIRNVELRSRLAGWDAVVSDLILDEETRRDFVIHELRPAFAEFGISGSLFAPSRSSADFGDALRSRTLLTHLTSQIGNVTHLLTHFEDAAEATEAMIVDLAEELSSL